jgi:NAD-dependent dihydropyrimidine dehydrogenase PreA subunit
MKDGLPQWQSDCSGCLACYHVCPHHAINFGKMTQKKGQYTLPKDL